MTKAAELAKMGEVLTNSQIGGRRNIIINGAMQVAQRATSVAWSANGYLTVDRFQAVNNNTAGRFTMKQSAITDLPGFANALELDVTTADTSIAAGEVTTLQYKIEGQDLQQLKKGTSSAEKVTLSFYVKANAARVVVAELMDGDNTRKIQQKFTTTTGWTRHILTFAADTTGALDDDNAESLQLQLWLHAGSTYTGGTFTSNTWAATTTANRAAGIDSLYTSTDNNFFITGVQLEVGSVATPFEHRSFGEELALCQRYYQQYGFNSGTNGRVLGAGNGGDTMLSTFGLLDQMRTGPTANYFGAGTDGANFNVYVHSTTTAGAAPSAFATDGRQIFWNFAGNGSYPNSAYWIDMGTGSTQFAFTLDSEL